MTLVTSIEDLELIGWNDVVDELLLPARVAPVFSFRDDPERVLLPPFRVIGGIVVGGVAATRRFWNEQLARRQASALDEALDARPGHTLWLDSEGVPHYEPSARAGGKLDRMAQDLMDAARQALEEGDPEEAVTLAQRAFNANDRWVDPLALKAAVRRRQGRLHEVDLLAELASVFCSRESFEILVTSFLDKLRPAAAGQTVPAPHIDRPGAEDPRPGATAGTRPMRGVAAERPDLASSKLFPAAA